MISEGQEMFDYRLSKRKFPIAAKCSNEAALENPFAPVDDLIDHCDLVSQRIAKKKKQIHIVSELAA